MNILEIPVTEMVEYLNEQRQTNGLSVKEICRINEVSYSAVQKKYNKEYIYNKNTKQLERREDIEDVHNEILEKQQILLQEELQELRELIDALREVPKQENTINADSVIKICEELSEDEVNKVRDILNKLYMDKQNKLDVGKLKGNLSGEGEFYSTKLDTNIKKRWINFTALQRPTVQELTQLALHELMERNGF